MGNNREGREGLWKRGEKGMKTKEGKEEHPKKGKVKPENIKGDMTNKVEKEKPLKNNKQLKSK